MNFEFKFQLVSNFFILVIMARKYSVKSRYYKKANYSRENTGFQITLPAAASNGIFQNGQVIVAPINTQGERTVGRFTISVPVSTDIASELYWALVYVPQGTSPNPLFSIPGNQTGSLYEPNQYVMASGVSDNSAGPMRIRTNMKRKLHSGDSIQLIVGATSSALASKNLFGLVSYSIKYN